MVEHKQGDDGAKELHSEILAWQKWLTFFAAALIISYVAYFGVLLGQPRAENYDKWGAFGDFFGGILNPIVAFAAFYWLTQSVKLQKQELAETRAELKGARIAQQLQVENGLLSARLSALSSIVNSYNSDLSNLNNELEGINRGVPSENGATRARYNEEHSERRCQLNSLLAERMRQRDKFMKDLMAVVERTQEPAQK